MLAPTLYEVVFTYADDPESNSRDIVTEGELAAHLKPAPLAALAVTLADGETITIERELTRTKVTRMASQQSRIAAMLAGR